MKITFYFYHGIATGRFACMTKGTAPAS